MLYLSIIFKYLNIIYLNITFKYNIIMKKQSNLQLDI